MKIKNWEEFQHFKDRTPPWIKLYRYLLDDPEWHELSGDDSKVLVMLWLIASEDKAMEGNLPNIKTLCFRLRMNETKLNQTLTKLSNWLIRDDINVISICYQSDAPEERRDRGETEENAALKILNHLNSKVGRYYKPIKSNLVLIKARLKEGFSSEDLIKVIDVKSSQWLKDDKMNKYLRPATLFNAEKCSQYAAEEIQIPKPRGLVI